MMRRRTRAPAGRNSSKTRDFTSLTGDSTYRALIRYVSSSGNDTTGDGSITAPYLTIGRALKDCPDHFLTTNVTTTLCYFKVRVIAPYDHTAAISALLALRASNALPTILIEAWGADPALFGTRTDPRFSDDAGPFASTAGAQYAVTRPSYTLPGASIASDDQHVGKFARIYASDGVTELARGPIVKTVASTQQIIIQCPTTFTAVAGHVIYVSVPSVKLNNAGNRICVINGGLQFGTIEVPNNAFLTVGNTSSAFAASKFMQCRITGSIAAPQVGLDPINAGIWSLRSPISNSGTAGVEHDYPTSEASRGCGGILDKQIATAPVWQGPLSLGTGSTVIGIIAPTNVATAVQRSQLNIGTHCTVRGAVDCRLGTYNPLVLAFTGTTATPTLLMRLAAITTALLELNNCDVMLAATGAVAVDNGTSTAPVLRANSGVRMNNTLRIDKADAAQPATAGLVVVATQDSSLCIHASSNQNGTGGDVQAGDTAADTYAAVAALTPPRRTNATYLASVRTAA